MKNYRLRATEAGGHAHSEVDPLDSSLLVSLGAWLGPLDLETHHALDPRVGLVRNWSSVWIWLARGPAPFDLASRAKRGGDVPASRGNDE